MACGILTLKWNNHKATCLEVLSSLYKNSLLSDATLVCEGEFYPVHKLVLSMCSEYFESLLGKVQEKHPFIVLNDVTADELDAILSYMYRGEVDIIQDKLSRLFKVAHSLKIKGLSDSQERLSPSSKTDISYNHKDENRIPDGELNSVTSTKMEEGDEKISDSEYILKESLHCNIANEDKTVIKEKEAQSLDIKCEPYDDMDSRTPPSELLKDTDLSNYFGNWSRSNSSNVMFDPTNVAMDRGLASERRSLLRVNGVRPMEKLYSCDMCNFVTTRSHGLKRHKMTHTGERPYACHFCSFKSIQKYYLKTHLIKEHNWH